MQLRSSFSCVVIKIRSKRNRKRRGRRPYSTHRVEPRRKLHSAQNTLCTQTANTRGKYPVAENGNPSIGILVTLISYGNARPRVSFYDTWYIPPFLPQGTLSLEIGKDTRWKKANGFMHVPGIRHKNTADLTRSTCSGSPSQESGSNLQPPIIG